MVKRIFIIIPFLLTNIFVNCQIYNKKIVYTYSYYIKNGNSIKTGHLYFGCSGKNLPAILDQEQYAVIWTEDIYALSKRNYNTGIIENTEHVWLHPPRYDLFSILEYSPFPEIKFPLKINNSWKWELIPGRYWVNKKYNITEDVNLSYSYIIKSKKMCKTYFSLNNIECYEVYAYSTNNKYKTNFMAEFNIKYGFISMTFINIDGGTIKLDLVSIDSWDKFDNVKDFYKNIGNW
jgi:hypothetical protein